MLNNKKFNIVLSLIIAISLWAYVIGETNPQDSRTFRDIPIQLINQQVLEDNDLAVMKVSAETLQVTLTGTRANIKNIDPKDISATVDLADAAVGENQIKINIRVPDNVEIEDKSHNKVTVVIEERISKEVDIVPEYEGSFGTEQEPITVEMNRSKVVVFGAKSLVDQTDHAIAVVGEGEVTEKLKTITCRLVPVDAKGKQIRRLQLSAKNVQVTAELGDVKTVELETVVVNIPDGVTEREYQAPKTITIKGLSSDLKDISKVTAEPIDISRVEESTTIPLKPILPENVQVSRKSTETLHLVVTVIPPEYKTFTFSEEDIELIGVPEEKKAVLSGVHEIEVVVGGKKSLIDTIEKDDFTLSVDVADLDDGAHDTALTVICSKNPASLQVNPKEIKVTIE